ncbi:MAG: hypothetical protein CMP23_01160 [Rickettsiales bacterium]|nr:hypothetical protein [Rickettsiales bacterium]|tara:strand:+ start:3931 stop:4686 length:756 start_codon:yes stop_codon:yes gene_type:complete
MRNRLSALFALIPILLFCSGFTGNIGSEFEARTFLGISTISSFSDEDSLGELGLQARYKFRNVPYDDLSIWAQVGFSWTTFPEGGDLGNQLVSLQWLGGLKRNWGEIGGGFVMMGDTTDVGPMLLLPAFHLIIGRHDTVQFSMGALNEMPLFTGGAVLHWEGIFTVPFRKTWAPRLKLGGRLNPYAAFERFPIEFYTGIEAHLGRHFRVGLDLALGDGGDSSNPPSFALSFRLGLAVGKGTRSEQQPQPID